VRVNPGLQIKVYVSIGETPVTVPDVANMAEADAIAALEAKGLVYGSTTQSYSATIPAGVVIDSDPPGGSERVGAEIIRKGHIVNLVVSNGLIQIPDVTGKTISQASSELNAIGLNPTIQVDQTCNGGIVASQSIVGDQPQKSPISLRYCSGS
ncbi:MAG: PASTA domain-containing protein, partial [Rhodoglobus sp.]